MIIVDQLGNKQEVYSVEQKKMCLYGQPKSIKAPLIFLGEYETYEKTFDIMAEIFALNSKDKKAIFTMPEK